jgi:ABC-type Fe3+-hydroxamate transport system substrate-binding protein
MGPVAMGGIKLTLVLAGLLLLLGGTACGERAEPTGSLVQVYPVTVQGAGDQSTVAKAVPRRIVPLGAGPRRLLKALGLQRRTVTVNDTLVGLPLVGEIRRAHPDLIVASSDTDPLDLARARTATHAAIYVEPDNSLDDVVEATGDVGLLTNQPVAARRVTAAIQRTRRAVAARLAGEPSVSVFVDTGDFSTVPSRSLLGDLITEAHGENVAGPSPEPGPFPLRRLAQLDPDVYLATAGSGRTLAGLRAHAETKQLRAVKSGRFGVVPPGTAVAGPAVGKSLVEVARILHPDAFR